MYINLANEYQNAYNNVKYGDGYLVGVHGVQTALNMQGYGKIEGVNLNSIMYGYYCVNTENMVTQFQKDNNLNVTETIDKNTWNAIFNKLLAKQGCVIIQTGDKEISIIDIDTYIELLNDEKNNTAGLNSGETLADDRTYPESDSGISFNSDSKKTSTNDILSDSYSTPSTHSNLDITNPGFTDMSWYDVNNILGNPTTSFSGVYNTDGSAIYDDLMYNYIVSGGRYYNGVSYSHNLNGGNEWNDTTSTPSYAGQSDKDYDFIYNLLANSVYGNYSDAVLRESKSTTDTIKYYGGSFDNLTNAPFFSPSKIDTLRKSKFDITIVYGAKGESARKIRQVTPISVSQEMNASGEPIYDVYEFVARDVSYGL